MEDNRAAKNTDVEIWRKVSDDYYSPSIHITEQGGINVGGYVLVAPVERWFAAGEAANRRSCLIEDDYIVRMPPLRGAHEDWKSGKATPPNPVMEDEVVDAMEICESDECFGCRYGSCDTCPPLVGLYTEFKAWDELSDEAPGNFEGLLAELRLKAYVGYEALENFEKLVEESEFGVPSLDTVDPNLIDYMEHPARRDS